MGEGGASEEEEPAEAGSVAMENGAPVPAKLQRDVSEATLSAISRAVAEAESRTSGEIVVHLVRRLLPLESSRRRAVRTFGTLGLERTAKRNGVLLFVAMKNRKFEILADVGVTAKVDGAVWQRIAEYVSETIDREGFERGICEGVARIGDVLERHFPRETGDVDELPDRPSVED